MRWCTAMEGKLIVTRKFIIDVLYMRLVHRLFPKAGKGTIQTEAISKLRFWQFFSSSQTTSFTLGLYISFSNTAKAGARNGKGKKESTRNIAFSLSNKRTGFRGFNFLWLLPQKRLFDLRSLSSRGLLNLDNSSETQFTQNTILQCLSAEY